MHLGGRRAWPPLEAESVIEFIQAVDQPHDIRSTPAGQDWSRDHLHLGDRAPDVVGEPSPGNRQGPEPPPALFATGKRATRAYVPLIIGPGVAQTAR